MPDEASSCMHACMHARTNSYLLALLPTYLELDDVPGMCKEAGNQAGEHTHAHTRIRTGSVHQAI
jgi:hypothetical protein